MKEPQACRQLLIPNEASLRIDYGLHRPALGDGEFAASFAIDIHNRKTGTTTRLLDRVVRSDQEELAYKFTVSLKEFAYISTDLCFSAKPVGETNGVRPREAIVWMEPRISSGTQPSHRTEPIISDEEKVLREMQLRTLGYIE